MGFSEPCCSTSLITAGNIGVFLRSLSKIHTFNQYLEDLQLFGRAVFEAIEVKGRSILNFEVKVKSKKIFQILMGGMNLRRGRKKKQMSSAVRSDILSCRIFVPIFWQNAKGFSENYQPVQRCWWIPTLPQMAQGRQTSWRN